MRLRERIAIGARDQLHAPPPQRQDRQLDHVVAVDQRGEDTELVAVDDVLGVVQHHEAGRLARRGIVGSHRMPQPVQVIGLGRRTGDGVAHQPHPVVPCGDRLHHRRRRRIIGIDRDINREPPLQPRQQRTQHRPDHGFLAKGGHENRDPARRRCRQRLDGKPNAAPPPCATREEQRVERKVVEAADQQSDGREQHQFTRGLPHRAP